MKRILIVVSCLLFAGTGFAQEKRENENSLLWKISGNGLNKSSYLFGTNHLICPDDYIWTEEMNKCFKDCDELCLEMNISNAEEMTKVIKGMSDTSGKKVQDYFGPGEYGRVNKYFKDKNHVDIDMYAQYKPIMLDGFVELNTVGCANPKTYEVSLSELAKEENKLINGLENADETIEIVSKIPPLHVIQSMLELVNGTYEGKEYNDKILAAYKEQNIKAIYEIVKTSGELGGMDAVLLDDRNKKWIAEMKEMMSKRSTFFAVGAGHLYGPNGVIHLLKEAGYSVEAMW